VGYNLTAEEKDGYLQFVVTGENSRENVVAYLAEIVDTCARANCFRVLIDERLTGRRLKMMDVFQVAAEGSSKARGKVEAIAYVDSNANGELMQFAETVVVNRSIPVTVFNTVAEAEKWLQDGAQ